jgi:5-methylcytosine-specific restriction endonuclease McrA
VHELRRCANPDCAKPFTTRSAAQLVCSDKCRNRINNVRKQIAARDRSPRPCGWCKTVFEPAYGDLRSLYCANACKLKAQYSARGSCTHRRRAKAHGVEFKQLNKWQVFARDKWRCQLCGVSTPRKYSGQIRDDAPQLDHIVPFAAGGAHVFENVQCACRRCNLRKMTRPMGQLHLALQ